MAKRPSKAEIKRRFAAANDTTAPDPMCHAHERFVAEYEPRSVTAEQWTRIRPFVLTALRHHPPTGDEALKQRLVALLKLAAWALDRGHPVTVEGLLTEPMVAGFVDTADVAKSTAANYRSRLRAIAREANPSGAASTASVRVAHRSVKPPYTSAETATITRIAAVQPNERTGRQLAACVGLGLGAGLDSTDLRDLRGRDVIDHGHEGIEVHVRGRRPRTVWVRRKFEDLVRRGVAGVKPGALVVGTKQNRKNMAARVLDAAVYEGTVPPLEQSRFRTTWISNLLLQGVTLPVLMRAAGLTSARTITDIVGLLPEDDGPDRDELRGGAR